MIEVNGVPKSDRRDCREIIYKTCELVSVDIKKTKTEIVIHLISNLMWCFKYHMNDLVYNNKWKLKEKMTKDLGYTKESSIFINESLSFDNKKLLYNIQNKSRVLGYNKIVTVNGVIKIKALNQQGEPKWVRILNRKDLDKLEWILSFIVAMLHKNKLHQIKTSELINTIFILLFCFALIMEQLGSAPLTLHYLIHNKRKGTRTQ